MTLEQIHRVWEGLLGWIERVRVGKLDRLYRGEALILNSQGRSLVYTTNL